MSRQIELIRAVFEDFIGRGSVEVLLANITGDAVLRNTIPASAPFGGEFHGRAGFLAYFERAASVLDFHSVEAADFLEGGGKVAVLGREVLRIKSTGEETSSDWCTVFTFREDLICAVLVIEDHSPLCLALAANQAAPAAL